MCLAEDGLPQDGGRPSSANSANLFSVKTETGEEFTTKTILIASGSGRRKLEAKMPIYLNTKDLPIVLLVMDHFFQIWM